MSRIVKCDVCERTVSSSEWLIENGNPRANKWIEIIEGDDKEGVHVCPRCQPEYTFVTDIFQEE